MAFRSLLRPQADPVVPAHLVEARTGPRPPVCDCYSALRAHFAVRTERPW